MSEPVASPAAGGALHQLHRAVREEAAAAPEAAPAEAQAEPEATAPAAAEEPAAG